MSTCSTLLKSQEVVELLGLLRLCEGWTLAESHFAGEGGSRLDPAQVLSRLILLLSPVGSQYGADTRHCSAALANVSFERAVVCVFERKREEGKEGRKQREPALREHASESGALRSPEFHQDGGVGVGEVGGSSSSSSFPSSRATLLLPGLLCLGF